MAILPSLFGVPYVAVVLVDDIVSSNSQEPTWLELTERLDDDIVMSIKVLMASYLTLVFLAGILGGLTRWALTRGQEQTAANERSQPLVAPPTSVLHGRVTTFQMESSDR